MRVSPWWMGPLLLNPFRRWRLRPERLLSPFVHAGMKVLEPGPGVGFFTNALAHLVGPSGSVMAVDLQPRMLDRLEHRAMRAGYAERVQTRIADKNSLFIADLAGTIDFVLAFATVHEMPSAERFFLQVAGALKPGGTVLLAEPTGHVREETFQAELSAAMAAGLSTATGPKIPGHRTAVLRKKA
jgi:SAM-dependent methyltransferase